MERDGGGAPPPRVWHDVSGCVDALLERVGSSIVLGTPLGLGKPIHTLNEIYRRAVADPSLELTVVTALTLTPPRARGELERRLLEPILERLFGGYPELDWIEPRQRDRLPANVRILEFYLQPGALLGSRAAQRDHVSSNYTHVIRDALDRGLNLYAQMVSERPDSAGGRFSLSSNPDLTLGAIPRMRARDAPCAAVADINSRLPYMAGAAEVEASFFDHVIRAEGHDFPLFGLPDEAVTTTDWMIALNASALIRDGGMLQLGIGSLSDGICHLLILRHEQNETYRGLLEAAGIGDHHGHLIERIGGTEPFAEGLYTSTEMLVDGYLALYRAGVLRRRAWPWAALQSLANCGRLGSGPGRDVIEALLEMGAILSPLRNEDLALLIEVGILREELALEGSELVWPDGRRCPADLREAATLAALERDAFGSRYRGGRVAHAAFFLGPRSFYEGLAGLEEEERELFEMTGISQVNGLGEDPALKRLQCRHARFVNTALQVTVFGGTVSDTLDDGRVVGGVGGQHDLVDLAHELEDARSILLLRSTREKAGQARSNIVFAAGHATLPRHLRDIVVTEYGIADLRGRTDSECCEALISVADSRFQPGLIARAQQAGKLRDDWEVPARYRDNDPRKLHELVLPPRSAGVFPRFPFGAELEENEIVLARCLRAAAERVAARRPRIPSPRQLARILSPPDSTRPYLERMGLERPRSFRERLLRFGVVYALVMERGI